MLLAPPPGQQYRDTATRQLVPPEGADLDTLDLDIARALACGDLVEVISKKAAKAAAKDEG